MGMLQSAINWYLKRRMPRIRRFMEQPGEVQSEVLRDLLMKAKHTEFGRRYDFAHLHNGEQFAREVPLQDYDSLKGYIHRMMHGQKDLLWRGRVYNFAKSSGTTSDKSKFIPVSPENLDRNHHGGPRDTMSLYLHNNPQSKYFSGRSLMMGGSRHYYAEYPRDTFVGDVSSIMIGQMPKFIQPFVTPDIATSLLPSWDEKMERMAKVVPHHDVTSVGGVPTWTIVLFRRLMEVTGKDNMLEIWPNFELYIHGGVSFTPYRKQFSQFMPSPDFKYLEIYNASEGYFATSADTHSDDMLLLLDNGIYYEFVPMDEWGQPGAKVIPLAEVELGKNYAMVISTNAGLWRYSPGDTVEFTSTAPYKIKITGRTKHFINAFGEEVVIENTDQAIAKTCEQLDATVKEYTVAPVFFVKDGQSRGGHEWIVEFEREPESSERFAELLDRNLQRLNSDYEAKRYKDIALSRLRLHAVPIGTFHDWLKSKGKYGGQHKVPRLSNKREYVEEILAFVGGAAPAE